MKISVVVCTFNGEKRLRKTLNALVQQAFAREDFEIILIDNNSSDGTKEVIQNFRNDHSEYSIKYFFEKHQGLSYARNRGVEEASGKILAFTDDDGIPEKDWLSAGYIQRWI